MTTIEYNTCVEDYSHILYRYCMNMCHSTLEAEDAVQEAFIKLWHHHDHIELSRAKSWLFTAAHRNVLDQFRKNKKLNQFKTTEERQDCPDIEQFELREEIYHTLESLSPEQKSALLLRDYEGYAYQDIAEILGYSLAKVKTLIFRARKALQQHRSLLKIRTV